MQITTSDTDLRVDDSPMRLYVAAPKPEGKYPGVLLYSEIFQLTAPIRRSMQCRIKRTFIGHHDPDREWGEQLTLDRELFDASRGTGCQIELAKPDTVIDL